MESTVFLRLKKHFSGWLGLFRVLAHLCVKIPQGHNLTLKSLCSDKIYFFFEVYLVNM